MINKNFYRKTNDKKILHKVGKQWKVVSVALLMAIGGAAVATHVSANADAVNDAPYAANQAQFKAKPASAKPQQQKSSASVSYYPAASGSAAYYFDHVASDNGVAAKNYNTVNSYVQSLNNEYNPQVNSYSAKSASASAAANNDAKLAKSYSAVVNNPNTAKTINSLAAKNHMNPTLYVGMVQDNEENFSDAVNNASADVKANSDVSSLTNRLENTNFDSVAMSASASSVVASSNVVGAKANLASVEAVVNGNGDDNAAQLINAARQLSYGATELLANGNGMNYNANLGTLSQGFNATSQASLMADFNSAVKTAVTSANNEYENSSEANDITGYAAAHHYNNELVSSSAYNADNLALDDNQVSGFNAAVSAATDTRYSTYLASAANSLFGKYNTKYATYEANSKAGSDEVASASAALRSAVYASDFANANNTLVDEVSGDVATSGAANVASDYLSEGVDAVEERLNLAQSVPNYGQVIDNGNATIYVNKLASLLRNHNNSYDKQMLIDFTKTTEGYLNVGHTTEGQFKQQLQNAVNALDNVSFSHAHNDSSNISYTGNVNGSSTLKNSYNLSSVISDATNNQEAKDILNVVLNDTSAVGSDVRTGATMDKLDQLVGALKYDLQDAANKAVISNPNTGDGLNFVGNSIKHTNFYGYGKGEVNVRGVAGFDGHTHPDNTYANAGYAALLSDGINLDQLEAESSAIDDVAGAAKSASASQDFAHESAAEKLDNELSVAASSANSELASTENASASDSTANDDDVTLASYFATSYSNAGNNESAVSSTESSELNSFFKSMADDATFNTADDAYAGAEAAAANDKKVGIEYSKVVFNNSPHFLDVLKNAKLHSSYEYGSQYDKVLGSVNKGDRLTVLGVNFSREGMIHGATRYLVLDNNTHKKGFITGQPQYTKAAYLNAKLNTNNVDVSVKTLKPVTVFDNLNGGKAVKTLKAGTVVDGVTIVNDNPSNDAMGFTKVETSDYNFFTANTDYVELNTVVPKNNNNNVPNNYAFNLNNVNLDHAYNNNSQY